MANATKAVKGVSATNELIIDPEFKGLIPPLSAGEFRQLEENILSVKKCRDALIIWQGTLVDGHNRYKICTEHGIKFTTHELKYDSREDVILWIVNNQFGRRNLTKRQVEYCRGKQYEAEKKIIPNQTGINQHSKAVGQNELQPKKPKDMENTTAKRLALQHNVSAATIKRDAVFSNVVDEIGAIVPEAKTKILLGEAKISKQALMKLAKGTKGEIEAVAKEIAEGTYKPPAKKSNKDSDIEGILDEIDQSSKSVHEKLISYIDTIEPSYSRFDKYLDKELSVSDNREILSRLHTHAKHINLLIQKLSAKQGADMDSDK
jgi:hypothetical protein